MTVSARISRPASFGQRFLGLAGALAAAFVLGGMLLTAPAQAEDAGLSTKDQNIYKYAFSAIEKDRWKEARREAARAKDPLLEKVVIWLDLTRPGPGRVRRDVSRTARPGDGPRRRLVHRRGPTRRGLRGAVGRHHLDR